MNSDTTQCLTEVSGLLHVSVLQIADIDTFLKRILFECLEVQWERRGYHPEVVTVRCIEFSILKFSVIR